MDPSKMMLVLFYVTLSLINVCLSENVPETTTENGSTSPNQQNDHSSVTQTVYGFLDFTTTIGNTVMVFSPQSAATSSEKPTSPVTIINEKPPENQSEQDEITPSKPVEQTPSSTKQETVEDTPTSFVPSTHDKKPSTKSLFKSSTTSSHNSTTSKTKPVKATPKSQSASSTTPGKAAPKDKPKSTLKLVTPAAHKTETGTESNASPQVASTKKYLDKKVTTKTESSTKAPFKAKTDKTKSVTPHHHHHLFNGTTHAKIIAKTEKPKTTNKVTTKSTTSTSSSTTHNADVGEAPGTVVIASRVEIHEGPTSVYKVKKGEFDAAAASSFVSPSSVQAQLQTEETKPLTAVTESEESTSETPATKEQDASVESSSSAEEKRETTPGLTSNSAEEPAIISSSRVLGPEYDFLSRQPSEVVDETFRVIDLKPNGGKYQKQKTTNRATTPADTYEETQPLGLITSLSDSVIKDGLTTVYETNVVGTVISGKYAQVLQSNSHVQSQKKIKPTTSSTARILKTVAPISPRPSKIPNLEPTPAYDEDVSSITAEAYNPDQGIKPSRKPSLGGNSFAKNKYSSNKNKFKEDYREDYGTTSSEEEDALDTDYTLPNSHPTSPSYQQSASSKKPVAKKTNQNSRPFKLQNNRFSRPTTPELATVSVFSESQSSVTPSYGGNSRRFQPTSRRSTKPATSTESEKSYTNNKRSFKSKIGPSNVENNVSPSSPTYKFKLSRPSGRWQYKTSPKPRVTIRRQDDNLDNITVSPIPQFTPDIQLEGTDQELSGSGLFPALQHEDNSIVHDVTPSLTAETLRVEISTPADFKDVYYEIATIKTPYSFQVGSVKNTRFITVTSTFEKNLVQPTESPTIRNEPLSENILVSTHNAYDKEPPLDSSIATLPPIGLAGDAETPPLETITESFSTTQLMLKTHILPVVRGGSDTTKYTLVQSYHVTRLVTATKTLPPMEVYQFVPSKTLNEFNTRLDEAGSEVHLELEFGDNNEQDDEARPNIAKALMSDLDLTNVGSEFDIADVDKNKILEQHLRAKKAHKTTTTTTPPPSSPETPTTPALTPDQLQQLALLKLLNPNAALPNLLTSSKPVIKIETAYETHILPIFNGASTFFTTISRPTATLTKTEYEYVTNTLPALQPSVFNPLFPQPSFQIATTPVVTQTMVTETDSKVLKLTFGAKTMYTTLLSTRVTPTVLTTYLTNSIPIQATAATFPGFFNPAPFGYNAPFPFVG